MAHGSRLRLTGASPRPGEAYRRDPDLDVVPVSPEIWHRVLELSEAVLVLTSPEELK